MGRLRPNRLGRCRLGETPTRHDAIVASIGLALEQNVLSDELSVAGADGRDRQGADPATPASFVLDEPFSPSSAMPSCRGCST